MQNKGYDSSARRDRDEVGARATVEMERVTVLQQSAKCCGGGPNARAGGPNDGRSRMGPNVPLPQPQNAVCAPKCPAVVTSPWDPVKTWLAVFLSVAMIVWAALGVYYIKFRKT